jgi:hypothetical protein
MAWTERLVLEDSGRLGLRGKPSASSELGEGQLVRCAALQRIEGSSNSLKLYQATVCDASLSSRAGRLTGT